MERQGMKIKTMPNWKPKEIIIHEQVRNDPDTIYFLEQCRDVPIKYVSSATPKSVIEASEILNKSGNTMLERIIAGKQVVYIAPANSVVDLFTMPDNRMLCPHFERMKLASNGCYYRCEWSYLKLTYRAAFPFITIRVQYKRIKDQLEKRLNRSDKPVIFNSGELADSLALEHLTRAGQKFIPWFGESENGYFFMLTKSDNVDEILTLNHNDHTVIAWSMNNETVSRRLEIGAPPLERRIDAALKVQNAGYPLRIRLDPIVPFLGWEDAYAGTIKKIFSTLFPERITIGTLRFEEGFYRMRNSIFSKDSELPNLIKNMKPMFSPKLFPGSKRARSGKYSFSTKERIEIFDFIISQIRKYSDCSIALCKESAEVWDQLGLDRGKVECVCQLDYADMNEAS